VPCPYFSYGCDCAALPQTLLFHAMNADIEVQLASYAPANVLRMYTAGLQHLAVMEQEHKADVRAAEEKETAELQKAAGLEGEVRAVYDQICGESGALFRGQTVPCPKCKGGGGKNDACMHMDTCGCGSHWCFCCGKQGCPRGGSRGCDANSCYMNSEPGWGSYGRRGEASAHGALQEFYRQRCAFFVREIKEETNPDVWEELELEFPGLLNNILEKGRSIKWSEIDNSEYPLFGRNKMDNNRRMTGKMKEQEVGNKERAAEKAERRLQRQLRKEVAATSELNAAMQAAKDGVVRSRADPPLAFDAAPFEEMLVTCAQLEQDARNRVSQGGNDSSAELKALVASISKQCQDAVYEEQALEFRAMMEGKLSDAAAMRYEEAILCYVEVSERCTHAVARVEAELAESPSAAILINCQLQQQESAHDSMAEAVSKLAAANFGRVESLLEQSNFARALKVLRTMRQVNTQWSDRLPLLLRRANVQRRNHGRQGRLDEVQSGQQADWLATFEARHEEAHGAYFKAEMKRADMMRDALARGKALAKYEELMTMLLSTEGDDSEPPEPPVSKTNYAKGDEVVLKAGLGEKEGLKENQLAVVTCAHSTLIQVNRKSDDERLLWFHAADLQVPTAESSKRKPEPEVFMVGDEVRVKRSVETPSLGWGPQSDPRTAVTHDSVGTVAKVFSAPSHETFHVIVNWSEKLQPDGWEGTMDDLELASSGDDADAKAIATLLAGPIAQALQLQICVLHAEIKVEEGDFLSAVDHYEEGIQLATLAGTPCNDIQKAKDDAAAGNGEAMAQEHQAIASELALKADAAMAAKDYAEAQRHYLASLDTCDDDSRLSGRAADASSRRDALTKAIECQEWLTGEDITFDYTKQSALHSKQLAKSDLGEAQRHALVVQKARAEKCARTVEQRSREAELAAADGRHDDAARHYEAVLRLHPTDEAATLALQRARDARDGAEVVALLAEAEQLSVVVGAKIDLSTPSHGAVWKLHEEAHRIVLRNQRLQLLHKTHTSKISSFFEVAEICCIESVRILLQHGANINDLHEQGQQYLSLLHWAARKGEPEVVNLLLDFGANCLLAVPSEADHKHKGKKALEIAKHKSSRLSNVINSNRDNHVTCARILESASQHAETLLATYKPGHLRAVCKSGDTKYATRLLNAGVDPNALLERGRGLTPLHTAAYNAHAEVIMRLACAGATLEERASSAGGAASLVLVLQNAKTSADAKAESLRVLLDAGADPNAVADNGTAALHCAAQMGFSALCTMLVAGGANVEAVNESGGSALLLATQNVVNRDNKTSKLATVAALLEAGADAGAHHHGRTELHQCVINRFDEIAALLIEAGADVNATNTEGNTPLHLVPKEGGAELLALLLGAGADTTVRNAHGLLAIEGAEGADIEVSDLPTPKPRERAALAGTKAADAGGAASEPTPPAPRQGSRMKAAATAVVAIGSRSRRSAVSTAWATTNDQRAHATSAAEGDEQHRCHELGCVILRRHPCHNVRCRRNSGLPGWNRTCRHGCVNSCAYCTKGPLGSWEN